MKKCKLLILLLISVVVCLLVLCACGEKHVHEYGEWTITKKATCSETGEQERYCSCGDKQVQTIPTVDHTVVVDSYVAPTCSSEGLTEGSHCSVCNTVIKKQEIIAKLEHKWDSGVVESEPTCSQEGKKVFTCTVCGETKTEKTPKLEHVWDGGLVDVQPTCSSTGKRVHTCTVCGATKIVTIPKLEHLWRSDPVIIEPTCTEKGQYIYTCTICGVTMTDPIPELGHDIGDDYTCRRCGARGFNMTPEELDAINKLNTLSNGVTESDKTITITWETKDYHGNDINIPMFVDVKIVNSNGVVVYEKTLVKLSSQDSVTINKSDINEGSSSEGVMYYKAYNTPYFEGNEHMCGVTNLPWYANISRPKLPVTLNFGSGQPFASCKIDSLTYTIKGNSLYLYISGEKTYDMNGNDSDSTYVFGVEVKDSKGNVVASSKVIVYSAKVGDRLVEREVVLHNCIFSGESYTIALVDEA